MMQQNAATKRVAAVPGYSRLFRRGAVYYFRVVVPRDRRTALGRTEIIKSLRTTDFGEAKRLVAFESASAASLLHAKRSELQRIKSPPREASKPSDAEIQRFVSEWFSGIEKQLEERYEKEGRNLAADARGEVLENLGIEQIALTAVEGDGGAYQPVNADFYLDRFLFEKGILCEKDNPEHRKLSAAFHQGRLTNIRRDIARIGGTGMPEDAPLFRNLSAYTVLTAPKTSISFGKLLNWFLDYIKDNRSETTFSTYQTPVRVMREVLGESTPVRAITRENIDRLFDLLSKRPQNLSQRYPGLTTAQAVAAASKRGDDSKLSPKTLENYYTNVLAVFNFARGEKYIGENPAHFRSLRDKFRVKERKTKTLFTAEELSELFHSALYSRPFPDRVLKVLELKSWKGWGLEIGR